MLVAAMPMLVSAGTSGPSPIPPPPNWQLSTTVTTLCRGIENSVPIKVTNPGADNMTSLQLGLVASRNIYTVGNGTVTTSTVPANGSVTIDLPIYVSLNTSNLVSAGVTVNYNYLTLYSDSEERNVSFSVETCPSPLQVKTNQVITSGEIENITLNLTDVANTTLSDISLQMSIPSTDAAILTTQPTDISSLAPGSSTTVSLRTFVFSSASQTFPLNVSAQFYESSKPVQILDTFPTLSTGTINMTASSITFSPTTLTPGSIFSVSFILTDTGTAGASAVTVTPLPPSGISVYGSNSVFVGDMSTDSQEPVTVTLEASPTASGSYVVPMVVSYINSIRQKINTTIDVPIAFSTALPSNALVGNGTHTYVSGNSATGYRVYSRSGSDLPVVIVAIIVVVAILAALYMKRRAVAERMKKWHTGRK